MGRDDDEGYEPARQAMVRVRDEQLARVLAGQFIVDPEDDEFPRSRFQIILTMNEKLNDSRSSYDGFIKLRNIAPDVAGHCVFRVLPIMVEIGDYALAEKYLGDPLEDLRKLNEYAREFPLYPPRGEAPRMWAELHIFVHSVALMMAVHRGLGRESAAVTLHAAALAGIESQEMRALAQREIAEPGVMMREIGEYRAANEA